MLRKLLQTLKSKRIGKIEFNQQPALEIDIDSKRLTKKGCVTLGEIFSEDEVKKIKDRVKKFKCFDPFRKQDLGDFSVDDIPDSVHVANYYRKDLVTVKEIMDIANHPSILTEVQTFLGATPTISNINMWWSIGNKEKAEQAQFFHRDVDDLKFCKLFIYLTDVDMTNGPHVYVEGSSNSTKLRKIRRYQDEEIEAVFGKENIKYFIAEKGNAFIVDTYGFHKGLLPEKSNRLLLQIQYSLGPIGIEEYEPIKIENNKYNKYVNRLLIK